MVAAPRSVLPPSPCLLTLTPEMVERRPSANLPCLGSAFDSFWSEAIARLGKGGGRVVLLCDVEFVWSCLPRCDASMGRQNRIESGIELLEYWLKSDLKGEEALKNSSAFFGKALDLTERMIHGGAGHQTPTEECNSVGGVALLSLLRIGRVAPSPCGSPPPASASISSLASTFSIACSRIRELSSTGEAILAGALTCLLCRRELQPVWDVEVVPALRRLAAETTLSEEEAARGIKRKASAESVARLSTSSTLLPPLALSTSSVS